MKKNQKIITLFALILIVAFGLIVFMVLNRTRVADNGISATITDVVDRPNQAEDGYYGITAQDNNGRRYSINATGYLNTPLLPEGNGETCANIPKVKIGDRISFNLPKGEGQDNTFDICYKKSLTGYYFRVE